jgi:hypothetical protein
MSEQQSPTTEQPIERGAAEEASGVPLTPTEDEARRTPPSEPKPDGTAGSKPVDPGQ